MLQDWVLEDIMEEKVLIGVDVSKDSLDVAIAFQKEIITFSNEKKGVDSYRQGFENSQQIKKRG
jgi:hypothetical protein